MAEVLYLFQSLANGEPVREFDEVFAVEDKGFKDCIHGRGRSKRQVLLMDSETLEEFGVAPGRVKENITTGVCHWERCSWASACASARLCSKS